MPQAPSCPIYPSDDVWHSNIQLMPVHPMSDTWIANMGGPSRLIHPDLGAYPYGYQLQVVDNTTLTTRLSFGYADESDDVPYPFTSTTPTEPASDAHAFMLNKDTCVLYELFDASWNGGRPTAGSGAVFDLKSHALRAAGWTSADAAGLPIWPGVLRYDEVARGLVDHAIRFTAQRTDRSYVWPARHQAGAARDPALPPMGARFRLSANFSFEGWMPPGQVADFWIRFSNSGTETWQRGVWGKQANLGLNGDDKLPYRLGMAADWLWDDRIATTTAATVAPGEIAEFRFKVRAPTDFGTYRLNLRPVIDGTVWMEDQGVFWLIVVR